MQKLLDRTNQALGRLDGITLLLPDPDQFIYTFVRKEAVLSSQIEGTQSSLSDLLLFEHDAAPGALREDARETANYIAALDYGLAEIARPGAPPLSARLLREVHARLLQSGRGADKNPGEFRRDQNWLGGPRPSVARFVPPPWREVVPAMGALERFIHGEPEPTPVLLKAALAHAQFETIHPFVDGNGRVGRLLITLLLCSEGVLGRPLLYLSLHFKRNRDSYYDHLQRVRADGAWEDWLRFFLEGVIEVADSTTQTTQRVVAMVERDRQNDPLLRARGRDSPPGPRSRDPIGIDWRKLRGPAARSDGASRLRRDRQARESRDSPRGDWTTARQAVRLRRVSRDPQ